MRHLIQVTNTYRVPTVQDALDLQKELSETIQGEIVSFTYRTKYIKEKGEIIEEYQAVTVKIRFNEEKEPDTFIDAKYEVSL